MTQFDQTIQLEAVSEQKLLPYTSDLPLQLYLAQQVKALDTCVIEDHGIAGIHLMKSAGRAAFTALMDY